jgi:DNA-binding NtrC family response regulator
MRSPSSCLNNVENSWVAYLCLLQVRAVLRGQREDEVEFPFRVSEQELDIIEKVPHPPASMLLLGRSGTGKTTVSRS